MPFLKKKPPKYRFHKGTNQAFIEFSGKRTYLGVYGSDSSYERYQEMLTVWRGTLGPLTEEEARQQLIEAKFAAITVKSLREKRKAGNLISINELVVVYRRFANKYYRKDGEVTREAELIGEVQKFLRKYHEMDGIDTFGPVALDELRDRMIDELDWSRKVINKQVGRIIRMFKWAASKQLLPSSVPNDLKALAGLKRGRTDAKESKGVTYVADDVVDVTLTKLGEVVSDMVRFQRLTGSRPGEVCSIRPCDIDRSRDIWVYIPSAHKTEHYEKNRVIAIGPQAQAVLLPYLLREAESYCFSPAESEERRRRREQENRTTPLSCGNKRGSNRVAAPKRRHADHYKVGSYRMAIRRACMKLGIEVWSPNRLRHTAATQIRKQFGLEAAQVVCGHQTADVTQVYAERDLELAIKVARSVG